MACVWSDKLQGCSQQGYLKTVQQMVFGAEIPDDAAGELCLSFPRLRLQAVLQQDVTIPKSILFSPFETNDLR